MNKTILITGSSSGIGKATAKLFNQHGWNVIATMRTPENETDLVNLKNVLVVKLDVTNSDTITSAIKEGINKFGKIDVLLNNAGYGAYGPLEAFSMEKIQRQFNTNVIGLLETTKGLLPHFRKNKSGTIVNVSSIGGQMTFPLGTLYHGTKFAVEGISEALHFELEPVGIKMKIIEPGMINTDFAGRSFDFVNDESMVEYQNTIQGLFSVWQSPDFASVASEPEVVASVIWEAVNDNSNKLRYTAGDDAKQIIKSRSMVDDSVFIAGIKEQFGL